MKTLYCALLYLIIGLFPSVSQANVPESGTTRNSNLPLDDLPYGEACSDSIPIPFASLPFCTTASTGSARQDYHVPCIGGPFNTAPDAVYCLRVPLGGGGTVTASLCGSEYNTSLHVWRNRHPDEGGTLIGCSNNACGDDGCVTFLAEADSFYYIIVDGGQGLINSGPYRLNIHEGTDCEANLCEPVLCFYPNFDFEPANTDPCSETLPFVLLGSNQYCGTIDAGDTLDAYNLLIPPGECHQFSVEIRTALSSGSGIGDIAPFDIELVWPVQCDPNYSALPVPVRFRETGLAGWRRNYYDCLPSGLYQLHIKLNDLLFLPDGTPIDQYEMWISSTFCECFTTSYQFGDDEQNNNSCAQLNPQLVPGDTVSGEIQVPADADWYRLDINGNVGQYVSINIFGNDTPGLYTFGQGLNPKLFLYGNQCQTMLINDDNGGLGNDARIDSFYLPPGNYSVKVEGNGTSGPYLLATSCASCPCERCPYPNFDDEVNNGTCNANNPEVQCGLSYCGEILNPNDLDYYTFIPPLDACTEFTIRVLADDTPGQCASGFGLDAAIEVYSGNCGWQMYSEDFGGVGTDPVVTFSQLFPETDYRIVVRASGNTSGRYILQIDCHPAECSEPCHIQALEDDHFDYEYCGTSFIANGCNGEFFSAYFIQCGEAYYGYSDANETLTDTDWYQFTVHENDDQVYVCLEATFDATISLIAPGPSSDPCWNRDMLGCKISPMCTFTCDTFCLAPGDYYIEVKPLAPFPVSCGKYRLSLQCADCQPSRPAAVQHLTIHYPDNGIVPDPNMTNIVLRWDAVQSADEYFIYRSTGSDPNSIVAPDNLISITTNTYFVDESRIVNNGIPEQTYYVVIANSRTDAAPCSINP